MLHSFTPGSRRASSVLQQLGLPASASASLACADGSAATPATCQLGKRKVEGGEGERETFL